MNMCLLVPYDETQIPLIAQRKAELEAKEAAEAAAAEAAAAEPATEEAAQG